MDYEGLEFIKESCDNKTGELIYIYKFNPEKFAKMQIENITKLENVFLEIKNLIQAKKFEIRRLDFRFDTFGETDHMDYLKLNNLLILCVSITKNLKNRYDATDQLTLEHLTLVAKGKYYEIENYNKAIQSNHSSPVSNRLEIRSKCLNNKTVNDIISTWINTFTISTENIDYVQKEMNKALLIKWNQEKDNKVKDVREFIRKYQFSIFCCEQLTELLTQMGIKNPKQYAYKIKYEDELEYISKKDLKQYVNLLIKNMEYFAQNGQI